MESNRIVELIHDQGEDVSPRWLMGSGFVFRTNIVLTAAHNLGAANGGSESKRTIVRSMLGVDEQVMSVLVRNDDIDLAVLVVKSPCIDSIRVGKIDRSQIDLLRDVTAVGFPNYKYQDDLPAYMAREPAQPAGQVPTVENSHSGHMVLKLESGIPQSPLPGQASPWEGLSGAGVFMGDILLGIVIEHHCEEGMGTLHFVPLALICELDDQESTLFNAALGIADWSDVLTLNGPYKTFTETPELRKHLQELIDLQNGGLLTPRAAVKLSILAVKTDKGWP